MTLDSLTCGKKTRIARVAGERSFCRRLMELGLVPGTEVELVRISPLGDLLQLRARGASISIRRTEAQGVAVAALESAEPATLSSQLANGASVAPSPAE